MVRRSNWWTELTELGQDACDSMAQLWAISLGKNDTDLFPLFQVIGDVNEREL